MARLLLERSAMLLLLLLFQGVTSSPIPQLVTNRKSAAFQLPSVRSAPRQTKSTQSNMLLQPALDPHVVQESTIKGAPSASVSEQGAYQLMDETNGPLVETVLNAKMHTEHLPENEITREDKGLLHRRSIGRARKTSELALKSGNIGSDLHTRQIISRTEKDIVDSGEDDGKNVPVAVGASTESVLQKKTNPNRIHKHPQAPFMEGRAIKRFKTTHLDEHSKTGNEMSLAHEIEPRSTRSRKRKSSRKREQGKRVFVPEDDAADAEKSSSPGLGHENDGADWGEHRSTSYSPYAGTPVFGDSSEHGMLSRLLDQNTLGFGSKLENQDKELTINQIERYSEASSKLPPGFTVPTGGISDFSDNGKLDVSIGAMDDRDQSPQDMDQSPNIYRKSLVPRYFHHIKPPYFFSDTHYPGNDVISSNLINTRFRIPREHDRRRSYWPRNRHFRHQYRSHNADKLSSMPDPRDFSLYEKFSRYPEIPAISAYSTFPKFPLTERFPKFPVFSRAESLQKFPHFSRFPEFEPNADIDDEEDDFTRIPPPPPLPPTLVSREHTNQREPDPRDEPALIDEPAPIREPAPIPEIAPIPELPPIKEIPPISESREKQPKPLDPSKTFDKAESNGGVKKDKQSSN